MRGEKEGKFKNQRKKEKREKRGVFEIKIQKERER